MINHTRVNDVMKTCHDKSSSMLTIKTVHFFTFSVRPKHALRSGVDLTVKGADILFYRSHLVPQKDT